MSELSDLIERCKSQKIGPYGNVPVDWFLSHFKQTLRELPGYTDEDRAVDRKVIDGAETLGELVDWLYFGWSLCEDPSMIAELIDGAYEKHGCIVSQPPPESGE